jgi:2-dehydro-3-deoxyphosphogluconate aldolase / (4S)-4-hydroxy-2-oxoglutarate aldolase
MPIPPGPRQALPAAITATRIVGVLRARTSAHLEAVALALYEAGVTCLEVTLTTPGALAIIPRLREVLGDSGTPHIPGAATPTEVVTAWTAGPPAVKEFPAAQLGGPAYVRALRDPLPEVLMVPTGGVTEAELVDYLAAGAVAVGVGSPLIGEAPAHGPDEAFRARVTGLLSRLQDWEQASDE